MKEEMDSEILIVKNLNAFCPSLFGKRQAILLDSASLVVRENDRVGIVGETGAGKSVLINAIGRNLPSPLWSKAEELKLNLDGKSVGMLEKSDEEMRKIWGKGVAFIPSNAREMLNPLVKVGKEFAQILRDNFPISREAAESRVIEMFRVVQMPDPKRNFHSYPHELSGGMAQRVIISIAFAMSPRLLVADEPTMGLDVTIQKQVLDVMAEVIGKLQSGVILATRDLGIVANYCNKIAVMHKGCIIELRPVEEFFENPLHPYSRFILKAAFADRSCKNNHEMELLNREKGEERAGKGCHFVSVCSLAGECCFSEPPPQRSIGAEFYVKCHRLGNEIQRINRAMGA